MTSCKMCCVLTVLLRPTRRHGRAAPKQIETANKPVNPFWSQLYRALPPFRVFDQGCDISSNHGLVILYDISARNAPKNPRAFFKIIYLFLLMTAYFYSLSVECTQKLLTNVSHAVTLFRHHISYMLDRIDCITL